MIQTEHRTGATPPLENARPHLGPILVTWDQVEEGGPADKSANVERHPCRGRSRDKDFWAGGGEQGKAGQRVDPEVDGSKPSSVQVPAAVSTGAASSAASSEGRKVHRAAGTSRIRSRSSWLVAAIIETSPA